MTDTVIEHVTIERLGHRGDGVAPGPFYVSCALPGERVEVEVEGGRGRLIGIDAASPDRVEPFCDKFGICGGCATQHLAQAPYHAWKRGLVVEALSQAGLSPPVAPVIDAHGAGRRRATLHAARGRVGFAQARAHAIIDLDACPVLVPALNAALPAARAIEKQLSGLGKPLDIALTATLTGIDCDIRGSGKVDEPLRRRLADLAGAHDLARLSLHGDVVLERRAPLVRFGRAEVSPPAGGFLQATIAADRTLASLVKMAVGKARRVADLFGGCGTFGLVLADEASVEAFDNDAGSIAALAKAVRATPGLRPVAGTVRDLFHRPLLPDELKGFDAVVFDPPRAGAEAQARRLAASKVKRVVAVSCSVSTFARDAAILVGGGYALTSVTPVDQFRHSAHVEIVGVFER